MTTSESLVSLTTSSHHHGTRRPSSKDLVWASSRGALEARKEDYFKINASPGSGGGSVRGSALDRGEVPSIATTRRPLEGATSEVVREDGWPDAAWPNPSGRQRQLQP